MERRVTAWAVVSEGALAVAGAHGDMEEGLAGGERMSLHAVHGTALGTLALMPIRIP
jgi:hypothetical protein